MKIADRLERTCKLRVGSLPVKAGKQVREREVSLDKLGLNKWQYLQAAGAQEGDPGWGERSASKGSWEN